MKDIESREVLASAYLRLSNEEPRMLVHAVIVNGDRFPLEVLCRRVSRDNLADRGASDPTAPPTCPYCIRELKKLGARASHDPKE